MVVVVVVVVVVAVVAFVSLLFVCAVWTSWVVLPVLSQHCDITLTVTPDHRKDLKNRSPNLGPYTTKGTLKELP